jgi:hypothetical protein
LIVLEAIAAAGTLKGFKMHKTILGVSVVTIVVAIVFYLVGVKFPTYGQKALGAIGQ